jgi:hypothetical protein
MMMKRLMPIFFVSLCLGSIAAHAQMTDMTVFKSNMRSRATSQFYQEEFQRIGAYKVKGNSFFLKGNNVTDLHSTLGYGVNLPIIYDTYSQKLSILQENRKDVVQLLNDEVDSFRVKVDKDLNNTTPMLFVNAEKTDPSKKFYLQKLTNGRKYNLYKHYWADMKPAAMDVAQTNVMEFKIVSDFYYADAAEKGTFTKIKPNMKGLKEKFKDNQDATNVLNSDKSMEDKLLWLFNVVDK